MIRREKSAEEKVITFLKKLGIPGNNACKIIESCDDNEKNEFFVNVFESKNREAMKFAFKPTFDNEQPPSFTTCKELINFVSPYFENARLEKYYQTLENALKSDDKTKTHTFTSTVAWHNTNNSQNQRRYMTCDLDPSNKYNFNAPIYLSSDDYLKQVRDINSDIFCAEQNLKLNPTICAFISAGETMMELNCDIGSVHTEMQMKELAQKTISNVLNIAQNKNTELIDELKTLRERLKPDIDPGIYNTKFDRVRHDAKKLYGYVHGEIEI